MSNGVELSEKEKDWVEIICKFEVVNTNSIMSPPVGERPLDRAKAPAQKRGALCRKERRRLRIRVPTGPAADATRQGRETTVLFAPRRKSNKKRRAETRRFLCDNQIRIPHTGKAGMMHPRPSKGEGSRARVRQRFSTQSTPPNKNRRLSTSVFVWSFWPDSNRRPTDYESVALPAALQKRTRLFQEPRCIVAYFSQLVNTKLHKLSFFLSRQKRSALCLAAGRGDGRQRCCRRRDRRTRLMWRSNSPLRNSSESRYCSNTGTGQE